MVRFILPPQVASKMNLFRKISKPLKISRMYVKSINFLHGERHIANVEVTKERDSLVYKIRAPGQKIGKVAHLSPVFPTLSM